MLGFTISSTTFGRPTAGFLLPTKSTPPLQTTAPSTLALLEAGVNGVEAPVPAVVRANAARSVQKIQSAHIGATKATRATSNLALPARSLQQQAQSQGNLANIRTQHGRATPSISKTQDT